MIQLGQYPRPSHTIAHLSDTHLLAEGRQLYGKVPHHSRLVQALAQMEESAVRPEALVFTGDLTDLGEPDGYERLKALVDPAAQRMGAQVIWVMGNHDERPEYSRILFGQESDEPQDRVYDIRGLRIIALDSTVPGYHHGDLTDAQLDWLTGVLATPAEHGSLLALHHPPVPTPMLEAMGMLELQDQDRLARVIEGSDVRGILGGHLHYSSHSLFAGIPVSVAAATCYTLDLLAKDRLLSGVDFGQSINLVHVYADRVVHSTAPVGDKAEVSGFPIEAWAQIEAMTPQERREAFSRKNSPFGAAERSSST